MISVYNQRFREEVINLILHVQNVENDLNITIEEQPDLLDIEAHYLNNGGQFWVALDNKEKVIGPIGLLNLSNENSVIKKKAVTSSNHEVLAYFSSRRSNWGMY